jgi:hypothetical protein
MGGFLRRALSVAAAAVLVVACVAPTLPLPPPAVPDYTTTGVPKGMVKLSSTNGVQPNAIVVTYNTDPAIPLDERVGGAQADGQGTWEAIIYAKLNDSVEIFQQDQDGNLSPPATVQLQKQSP